MWPVYLGAELMTWNKEHSLACPQGSSCKFDSCEERVPERGGPDLSLESSQICLPEPKLILRREV